MNKIKATLKKRSRIIIAVLAVSALAITGVTYALLNARTEVVANNFAGAAVNIGVLEKDSEGMIVYEDMGTTQNNTDYKAGGNGSNTNTNYTQFTDAARTQHKEVAVKNINSKEYPTTDTYVRVRLVPTFVYDTDEVNEQAGVAGQIVPMDLKGKVLYTFDQTEEVAVDGKTTGCWKSQDIAVGDTTERYYYYTTPLAPDEVSGNLIKEVAYIGEIPEHAHFELIVLTEGLSVKQSGSIEMWSVTADADGVLTGLDSLR